MGQNQEELKDIVLKEYEKGNVAVMDMDGINAIPMSEFIKQPADGMLYDLNRTEAGTVSMTDNPRWINDYAVAKVIKALKARVDELEKQVR